MRSLFRLQYISDIHSEYKTSISFNLEPKTNLLALVGDVGNPFTDKYKEIIKQVSTNFDKVFYVAGNHEYYQEKYTINDVNEEINTICNKYNNVHFLNNSSYSYDEYLIHGSTLWSKLDNNYYNGFIKTDYNKPLRKDTYNLLHKQCVSFLENNINNHISNKNIVLTHYLPSYDLILDKYKNNKYRNNYYANKLERYATNLNYMLDENHILCWLYGHTHDYQIKYINGVYCSTNPHYEEPNRISIYEDIKVENK